LLTASLSLIILPVVDRGLQHRPSNRSHFEFEPSLCHQNADIENSRPETGTRNWPDISQNREICATETRDGLANSPECRANFCEPDMPHRDPVCLAGWGARIRTWECRNQNPVPYHLATPHQCRSVRGQDHSGAGPADQCARIRRCAALSECLGAIA